MLRLVGGLKSAAGPRADRVGLRAASAAAIVGLLILIARDPTSDAAPVPPSSVTARAPAVAGLLAAQVAGWRLARGPPRRRSLFTVGLSGLATVGCLRAGAGDPEAAEAARRGCDFLVAALETNAASPGAVSPDLALRAQAAASWALGMAALHWPERYRDDAIAAMRRLGRGRGDWTPAPATSPRPSSRTPSARPPPSASRPRSRRRVASRLGPGAQTQRSAAHGLPRRHARGAGVASAAPF